MSSDGTDRVPWEDLKQVIEINFNVTESEAAELANNALRSSWRQVNDEDYFETDNDRRSDK